MLSSMHSSSLLLTSLGTERCDIYILINSGSIKKKNIACVPQKIHYPIGFTNAVEKRIRISMPAKFLATSDGH